MPWDSLSNKEKRPLTHMTWQTGRKPDPRLCGEDEPRDTRCESRQCSLWQQRPELRSSEGRQCQKGSVCWSGSWIQGDVCVWNSLSHVLKVCSTYVHQFSPISLKQGFFFFFIATQKWLHLPDHGVHSRPPGEGLRTLTFNFLNTFQSVSWIFKICLCFIYSWWLRW